MAAPVPTSETRPTWPFLGRGGLLQRVQASLAKAGAVLAGPEGIGKTALAGAAVPRAAARIVGSPAGRDLPLWAVRTVVPDAADEGHAASLLTAHLGASGRAGRPVLLVDDLDHLDPASLAVVLHLVAEGTARLVATRRDGPPPPGVDALWREAGVERIDVDPLGEDDVAELVREALGAMVDGRALDALWRRSRGNPGLLRDAVEASLAAGTLVDSGGLWRLDGELQVGTVARERAQALLDGGGAAAEDARALELLAAGGDLPLAVAVRVVPEAALEDLQRRGLVELEHRAGPGCEIVRLADPSLASAVDAVLPTLARRRCSAELAAAFDEATAAGLEPDGDLRLRAIVWAVEAGRPQGPDVLFEAAHLAVDGGDTALGERLARLSVEAGGGTPPLLLQSWCADERGGRPDAEDLFSGHPPEDEAAAIAVAIRRAEQRFWMGGDAAGAAALMAEARSSVAPPWDLALDAQDAVFLLLDGRTTEALTLAEPLLEHDEPMVHSPAALAAAVSLAVLDRPAESRAVCERALERLAGPTHALFIDPGVHAVSLLFAQQAAGDLRAADDTATAIYRHTLARPGRRDQGWAGMLRAWGLMAVGRPRDAAELGLEAELVWLSAGVEGTARWSATIAALASAELADAEALTAAVERAERYAAAPFRLFDAELMRARAWQVELGGGDPCEALVAAAEAGLEGGRPSHAASAAHDLVRAGRSDLAAGVLARVGSTGPVTEARRALAAADAAGDAAALVAAAGRFDAMGAAGWAAEARALASARTSGSEGAALRRAAEAEARRTGLATPPLRRLVADRRPEPVDALTAREAEVARLAAAGLSNRDIAERLLVSLRTVENHLHRAFLKLGVTSRSDLADHL